jgi:hypothetical protein
VLAVVNYNKMENTHEIELAKKWDSGWRWGLLVGSLLTGVPMLITLWLLGIL